MASPSLGGQSAGAQPGWRPMLARWRAVTDSLVELSQPFPTRYHAAAATVSRLDRAFVALPPWAAL
eukprot:148655-Lingulodinium_polyedra.AAC.1